MNRGPQARERVVQLLETYGAEPARWPEQERAGAQALLASDAELQRLQAQARALDSLLALPEPLAPSAALRRAVAEIPLRAERGTGIGLPWLLSSVLRSALAAAFVLGLGAFAGASSCADGLISAGTEHTAEDQSSAALEASVAEEDALDTVLELAFTTRADEEQTP